MYNYYVFAWNQYYPSGGLNDLKEQFTTIEECWKYLASETYEHYQIVNKGLVVIAEG